LLLSPVAPAASAAEGQDPGTPQDSPKKLPPKLKAWPKPKSESELKDQIARLRQDRSKELAVEAQETLISMGASAAPLLVRSLGREKDKHARKRILAVLDEVVDQRHTRLVAESFDNKSLDIRVWALRTVSLTPDPQLKKAVAGIWKKIERRGDKASELERYAAGLCLLSVQDLRGLDPVFDATISHWKERAGDIRLSLNGLRSETLDAALLERLKSKDRKQQSAALRLISAGGTPATLSAVAPFLDSGNPTLRVDAINACRVLIAGEPPLDKIPVFEAIELAQAWKERI